MAGGTGMSLDPTTYTYSRTSQHAQGDPWQVSVRPACTPGGLRRTGPCRGLDSHAFNSSGGAHAYACTVQANNPMDGTREMAEGVRVRLECFA